MRKPGTMTEFDTFSKSKEEGSWNRSRTPCSTFFPGDGRDSFANEYSGNSGIILEFPFLIFHTKTAQMTGSSSDDVCKKERKKKCQMKVVGIANQSQ
jgi:hypothetical protein